MGLRVNEPMLDSSTHRVESASQGSPVSHCTGYGGGPRSGSIDGWVTSKIVQQTRVQRLALAEAGADHDGLTAVSKMYVETAAPVASRVLFVGGGEMKGSGHISQPSGRMLQSKDLIVSQLHKVKASVSNISRTE